ncbi:MAG: YvrJ family protein [Bacillota bacterium]
MEDIYTQIVNLGFPIAVSIYLLVRIENKLEHLSASIQALANVIAGMK